MALWFQTREYRKHHYFKINSMKKKVIVLAILTIGVQLDAQVKETLDSKRLLIGFNIGCNYTNIITPGDHLSRTRNGAGFRLGLLASEEVNDQITLSPKAELCYNSGYIVSSNSVYNIFPINVDIMLHINHKLKRGKLSPYVLAGPNIRIPVRNRGYKIFPNDYGTNPDVAIDLGFGYEHLKKYFCFAPEFRYSVGLLNVNKDPSLSNVYFHNITMVLNFKS